MRFTVKQKTALPKGRDVTTGVSPLKGRVRGEAKRPRGGKRYYGAGPRPWGGTQPGAGPRQSKSCWAQEGPPRQGARKSGWLLSLCSFLVPTFIAPDRSAVGSSEPSIGRESVEAYCLKGAKSLRFWPKIAATQMVAISFRPSVTEAVLGALKDYIPDGGVSLCP